MNPPQQRVCAPPATPDSTQPVEALERLSEPLCTARREAEEILGEIMLHTADLIFITSTDGRVERANQAVQSHFDVTPSQFEQGVHFLPYFWCGDSVDVVADTLASAVRSGRPASVDVACDDRHYELLLSAVLTSDPPSVVCIGRDVTDRHQAEATRLALEHQLLHSQKMDAIGRLASGVAHDFNNLLTAIGGYSDLVLAALDPADPMHADVSEIRKAGARAAGLTRQLLAFSRKQAAKPRPILLGEVVAHAERMLSRIIGEGIRLELQLAPELWPVHVDPGHIDQILVNLAVNARDAMQGQGVLCITTTNQPAEAGLHDAQAGAPGEESVVLTVSDNGCGMDAETVDRIFEPFFSTKPKHQGTGLGLSTVYGIVSQNGGRIVTTSRQGFGTSFQCLFPRFRGSAETLKKDSGVYLLPGTKTGTVLVVEDEVPVRRLVLRMLDQLGYKGVETARPAHALQLFAEAPHSFDVLLSDIVMPDMTGPDLFEAMRALRADLPVVFMTGYGEDVLAASGVKESAFQLLQKPFSATLLGTALSAATTQRHTP